jgi:hypothetical protein
MLHPRERCPRATPRPIILNMPCVLKLIMDLVFGPEEQIAYVSVTTR